MRSIGLISVLFVTILVIKSQGADDDAYTDLTLRECTEADFHYEYTACDSDGGRWRVSVPNPFTCVGGSPPAPVRGQSCDFKCDPGEYLDIATDQECHKCPAGRFSLGGGVLYNIWKVIPQGFTSKSEAYADYDEETTLCREAGWLPNGNYITTNMTDCVATLVYSANLVREGSVTFVYRYFENGFDTALTFEIENGQCQTKSKKSDVKYLDTTDSDEWKSSTYQLKAGVNILTWRLYSFSTSLSARVKRFIAIQSVEINGVAFTSNCTECEAGTFSSVGASICEPCPVNTYSKRGAEKCSACNEETQYSASGSSECYVKPPCTAEHYIMYFTPCTTGHTQRKYKWIEPKWCLGGVTLPEDGDLEPCPPCNVGMQLVDGICQFCNANEFSDGNTECQPCPGSTTPETAVVFKQWSNLPQNANITLRCMSLHEAGDTEGCMSEFGWAMSGNYVKTVPVNADDVYSVLSIDIGGFRSSSGEVYNPDVSATANAELSFLFDTVCHGDCEFMFFMQKSKGKTELIEMWTEQQLQVAYRLSILTELPVKFSWAYRKSATSSHFGLANDHAKIYMINITNTLSGGAAKCKHCPRGATGNGCIPCPPGHYINSEQMTCVECPKGTVIYSGLSWGVESCVKCGPGLEPFKGQRCISHCTFHSPDQKDYNFTELSRNIVVQGPRLFTQTGHAYFHQFNISLCGNNDEFELAYCNHNMTSSSTVLGRSEASVTANICQRTILLSQDQSEPIVSVSPISLGSSLVSVTNVADANITRLLSEAGFKSENLNETQEIYMKYTSETPTAACRLGRTVTIVLHCTVDEQDSVTAELPPNCGDGTCDGCNFIFMIKSPLACPICKEEDIETFTTPCVDGKQSIVNKTKILCNVKGSKVDVTQKEYPCYAFWQDQWPLWLKVVIILVPMVLICGVILFTVVISCWIKNRNLEYKYMKLIESSSGNDSEMPAPEVCGLDEGDDEDEQFDAVKIRKGTKFFSKLRVSQKRGENKRLNSDGDEDDDSFESMRMTDKTSLT